MGGRSTSITELTEENVQNIDSTEISLEDIDGPGVANVGGDVSITVADSGAIVAAQSIALEALDANAGVADDAFGFGEDALDFAGGIVDRSFDSQDKTVQRGFSFGEDALGFGEEALGLTESVFDKSIRFLTETSEAATKTLSGAITKVSDASRTDSANVLNNFIKFGTIGVGVVVLGLIVMRGRS